LSGFNIPGKRTWNAIPNKEEVELFTPAVEYLLSTTDAHVVLLPHSYDRTAEGDIRAESEDYQTLDQIYHNKSLRDSQDRLTLVNGVYSAPELKGVIGEFDIFLSGRLHAGAAGYSQGVPTALLAYGHKHYGFAELYKQEDYVIDGQSDDEILDLVQTVWENRGEIEEQLSEQHPSVEELAERNFELLAEL
jgi:colanic acid/amylovoran biosynthesis protein